MENKIKVTRLNSIEEIKDTPCYPLLDQNWEGYPSNTECKFQIGTLGDQIVLHYTVHEPETRAVNTEDHGSVWEDSCVEFFAKLPESDRYCNFEFNSLGTCLASSRKSRKDDVRPFGVEDMSKIKREAKTIEGGWTLTVTIPVSLLGAETMPKMLKANVYKCGDLTAQPHFHSWCKIETPNPDFHRPEFFGTLEL